MSGHSWSHDDCKTRLSKKTPSRQSTRRVLRCVVTTGDGWSTVNVRGEGVSSVFFQRSTTVHNGFTTVLTRTNSWWPNPIVPTNSVPMTTLVPRLQQSLRSFTWRTQGVLELNPRLCRDVYHRRTSHQTPDTSRSTLVVLDYGCVVRPAPPVRPLNPKEEECTTYVCPSLYHYKRYICLPPSLHSSTRFPPPNSVLQTWEVISRRSIRQCYHTYFLHSRSWLRRQYGGRGRIINTITSLFMWKIGKINH